MKKNWQKRLEQANRVLKAIDTSYKIEKTGGGLFLSVHDNSERFKWVAAFHGSDFPKGFNNMPFGSTRARAVTELIRWIKGDNVRPLDYWQETVKVGFSPKVVDVAKEIGWPETVPCVNCGRQVGKGTGWDHYDNDVVGPGCLRCPKEEK